MSDTKRTAPTAAATEYETDARVFFIEEGGECFHYAATSASGALHEHEGCGLYEDGFEEVTIRELKADAVLTIKLVDGEEGAEDMGPEYAVGMTGSTPILTTTCAQWAKDSNAENLVDGGAIQLGSSVY